MVLAGTQYLRRFRRTMPPDRGDCQLAVCLKLASCPVSAARVGFKGGTWGSKKLTSKAIVLDNCKENDPKR